MDEQFRSSKCRSGGIPFVAQIRHVEDRLSALAKHLGQKRGEFHRYGNSDGRSGSWRTTKFESLSDNGATFTYKIEGDALNMSTPTGQSYFAKLDGTDSPFKGDPGVTSVSVKRMGKNSIEETDKRDGKVISVSRNTVSGDGKTMTIAWSDKLHGTSGSIVAVKQ
jgi:hypothetical protein